MTPTPPSISDPSAPRPRRRIRVVGLDCDGTILAGGVLRPRTAAAITAAQRQGVRVVMLTGRMYRSAVLVAQALGLTEPLVCSRGAVVRAMPRPGDPDLNGCVVGTMLRERRVDPLSAQRCVEVARSHGWHLHVNDDERILAEVVWPEAAAYERLLGVRTQRVDDLAAHARERGFSAGFFLVSSAAEGDRCEAAMRALLGDRVDIARGDDRCVEVHHRDATKLAGLELLCRGWGVSLEECVAVDDSPNGLDMVRGAGFGVAVEGGAPEVLAAARVTCPPPERDGVAVLLDALGLTAPPRTLRTL